MTVHIPEIDSKAYGSVLSPEQLSVLLQLPELFRLLDTFPSLDAEEEKETGLSGHRVYVGIVRHWELLSAARQIMVAHPSLDYSPFLPSCRVLQVQPPAETYLGHRYSSIAEVFTVRTFRYVIRDYEGVYNACLATGEEPCSFNSYSYDASYNRVVRVYTDASEPELLAVGQQPEVSIHITCKGGWVLPCESCIKDGGDVPSCPLVSEAFGDLSDSFDAVSFVLHHSEEVS